MVQKLNYEKVIPLLGKQPDTWIAKEFGVSRQRIHKLRKARHIKARGFVTQALPPLSALKRYSFEQLLKFGYQRSTIKRARKQYKIPLNTVTYEGTIINRVRKFGFKVFNFTDEELAEKIGASLRGVQDARQRLGYYKFRGFRPRRIK